MGPNRRWRPRAGPLPLRPVVSVPVSVLALRAGPRRSGWQRRCQLWCHCRRRCAWRLLTAQLGAPGGALRALPSQAVRRALAYVADIAPERPAKARARAANAKEASATGAAAAAVDTEAGTAGGGGDAPCGYESMMRHYYLRSLGPLSHHRSACARAFKHRPATSCVRSTTAPPAASSLRRPARAIACPRARAATTSLLSSRQWPYSVPAVRPHAQTSRAARG